MAIQSRRGNISNFDKSKMLPGEWGIALDSQEAFVCFGAGTTKKMATYEDYQDMIDDCITVTQTAQGVVDSFNNLEIEKLAIDDASVSYITGWSSEKITKHDTKDNVVTYTETATRENISTGEKHSVLFGKIRKWFSDLKSVAFTGKYTDLTNVAIENPTTLPTASADTLGKIYRDGTGLKITLRSGNEGSYTYSWIPFISKDNVVNNFVTTEDGFVADARGLKTLKDGLDVVNNNLNTNKALITPLNGWTNNAVSFYAQKIGNRVFLGGMLNVGTITKGTTLAVLPEGYRPSYLEVVSVNITSGTAGNTQLNILADGTIWLETIPSGASSISVNNISFAVN